MLTGLNHLTLAVCDLARSLAFYQSLPGIRLHARWDAGAYLSCGDLWLCLSLDGMAGERPIHYTHYAFSVSAEAFPQVVKTLEQRGVQIWKDNRSEGHSFYFLDPDNHQLELHVGDLASRLAACREKPYRGMTFQDAGLTVRQASLTEILELYHRLPEFEDCRSVADLQARLSSRQTSQLIACVNDTPAGFKLGYALSETEFYSWLGGVLPEFRRDGVAQALLVEQEKWAMEQGYRTLTVKTRNKFRGMLMMLLKNGYQLVELEQKGTPNEHRLLLQKSLSV
ncbi:fosfomycin resistance glutathione transferase [Enterobacteriaceae bacterium RIT693]|jgi:catechol 2,3-dioxygenase-like lactoylglutathione lyase family enzyme|nr:fosfomycin resistance glutathione transferase [Enterobacteriaceae bacterium RIT693]